LIDGLAKQVALDEDALTIHEPGIAVRGALCFIDTELPLLGTPSFGRLTTATRQGAGQAPPRLSRSS